MQSFDIAVNDNDNWFLMTITMHAVRCKTAAHQPTHLFHASDGLGQWWVSLRLTDTWLSLVHTPQSSLLFRSCAQLLSPVIKVGLTVRTFIGIMKCRIFNCRLRQTTLFFIPAVPIPASSSKYYAVCTVIMGGATIGTGGGGTNPLHFWKVEGTGVQLRPQGVQILSF